ncbi:4-alpha-glucanotransferase [Nitrospira lenta]|uniref:4-alpha-glucanotransferase n=1 Tax=Nitrospira lenta TaxID=1436998 RepID=A0A330L031_9BACT|nr:4-alpha-glucanotransferase [Nitrospira lenta]SPP63004.1 4-alpha-glucanotransferase [Nitrospira lenta]
MYDLPEAELLNLLSDRAGVAADYHDIAGVRHVTTDDTRRAILSAMGFRVSDRSALIEELTAWDQRPWERGCDPVCVVRAGQAPREWPLHVRCEASEDGQLYVHWMAIDERGEKHGERNEGPSLPIHEERVIQGRRSVRLMLPLPLDLPIGYYDVKIWVRGGSTPIEFQFRLIMAPARCYAPESFHTGARTWGFALQLYSLRSERNWGVGDFGDLSKFVEWAGTQLGAGVIGLNPLHALKNTRPYHISPYSPSSRLYLNELYIDIDQVAEAKTTPDVQSRLADPAFRAQLTQARTSDYVDYEAVAALKRTVLDLCYRTFVHDNFEGVEPDLKPTTARGWFFHSYVQQEGEPLAEYALFQALEEERQLVQSSAVVWADWPEAYREPASDAVAEFKRRHMKRVRFFQYVQWLAAEQLIAVGTQAGQAGMPLGLYQDLALGGDRYGADGWRFQRVLAHQADCGAPPDAFAPEGQNWGLSPSDPVKLRASGYQFFIELLRNNLRYGGAIRIDHVMALFRLFWIPRGMPASKGTYVYYPADDLLAILALESTRARTLVIGEDLGTVPDWVRDRLAAVGVLSYRVLYFERNGDGSMKSPSAYPSQALGVVTTHDLPTLSGYWEGTDIETRVSLGLCPTEEARQHALAERHVDKARLLAALSSEGLLPNGMSADPAQSPVMTTELMVALHLYLARTPAWVVLANVEDVLGQRAQINVPGTVDQHPNWSRKLTATIEQMMQDSRFASLAAQLRSARPPV